MKITADTDSREDDYAVLLRDARTRPFAWGEHDCVTFAAAAVRVRTGRNVLAEIGLEPTWRTAIESARAIESVGGLRAALTRLFGAPGPQLSARLGDVVLLNDPENGRELLGICHAEIVLAPSANGLAMLPLSAALVVWHP